MKPQTMPFPDGYPELLEQIGQVIFTRLLCHDIEQARARNLTFDITEAVRMEIGGVQQYIPRGLAYDLSRRDEKIWSEFTGNNYQALAMKWKMSEMQVRNIVKRARARDQAMRQGALFPGKTKTL